MIGTLRTVVLDAPDARRLAAFYAALGGWTEQYADDDWITMETGDGWRIAAQRSPDHVPPRWPDPAYPQQAHLDLRVPDLDAGSAKVVELGAELLRKNALFRDRNKSVRGTKRRLAPAAANLRPQRHCALPRMPSVQVAGPAWPLMAKRVAPAIKAVVERGRMICRAAASGLSDCHECVRRAAAAAGGGPG